MTKDKLPTIFHDPDLKRMADVDSKVIDVEYADLPKLSARTLIHFPPEKYYNVKPGVDSQKIPLIEVNATYVS